MNLEIVKQVFASDIINWIFAAGGGAIAYFVLHRMQNKRERHSMIKEVEDSISNLMDQEKAKNKIKIKNQDSTQIDLVDVNFRTVLHDNSPWILFHEDNISIQDGQRYILIRNDSNYYEMVSTALIHESLLWFRRVNKLYDDRIITKRDIADLWRQILPFMCANKLEFYRSYLGKDDTKSILLVCLYCLYSIKKLKRETAINYASDMIKECKIFDGYIKELSNWRFYKKFYLKRFYKKSLYHETKSSAKS